MDIIVVVREVGRLRPEYSRKFEVPVLPRVGDYLSVSSPDLHDPLGEDLIVRKVWWRLLHPALDNPERGDDAKGRVIEIFVECETALGPYASRAWRSRVEAARARRILIEEFDVARPMASWGE